jgi:hypothetical protein
VVSKLAGWAKEAGEKTVHLHRLNIGARLTFCFIFIIVAMLAGNGILLWQFHRARAQAERLSGRRSGVNCRVAGSCQSHVVL